MLNHIHLFPAVNFISKTELPSQEDLPDFRDSKCLHSNGALTIFFFGLQHAEIRVGTRQILTANWPSGRIQIPLHLHTGRRNDPPALT
jgi:hypothetical protein